MIYYSLDEIEVENTFSPLFYGGLGNMLFQIAGTLSFCHDNNYSPLFCWWTSEQSEHSVHRDFYKNVSNSGKRLLSNDENSRVRNPQYDPIVPLGNYHIQLIDIFPRLPVLLSRPYISYHDCIGDPYWEEGYVNLLPLVENHNYRPIVLHSYFFDKKNYHHNREYILENLKFSDYIIDYVQHNYSHFLKNGTIGLHLRLGQDKVMGTYNDSFAGKGFNNQPYWDYEHDPRIANYVKPEWLYDIIKKYPDDYTVLVATDSISSAEKIIHKLNLMGLPKSKFFMLKDESYIEMATLSLCDSYIGSISTFSYWATYLNKNQPNNDVHFLDGFLQEKSYKDMHVYDSWNFYDSETFNTISRSDTLKISESNNNKIIQNIM